MSEAGEQAYSPIADYGLIGDCHTAALVSREGSVDWYCPVRFDGPAVFCRLLDAGRGGFLAVLPSAPYQVARRYAGASNVLETTFTTSGGSARLTDFMPQPAAGLDSLAEHREASFGVVRLVEGLSGVVEIAVRFRPTPDYARSSATVSLLPGRVIARGSGETIALVCPGASFVSSDPDTLTARLRVAAAERYEMALIQVAPENEASEAMARAAATDWSSALAATRGAWASWADRCTYQGPYRDLVVRSLLALKSLTYAPTGTIVAAPTTSLPEQLGGQRNWDYRFTWLRDSTLILSVLLATGYTAEADMFFNWLKAVHKAEPFAAPQVLYRVDGGRDVAERTIDCLDGYRGSRPVRLGNGAGSQTQLDVYGDILRAAHLYYSHRGGRTAGADRAAGGVQLSDSTWALLCWLVEEAANHWTEKDSGLWEVRGGKQEFLYSRLMCWTALDRGIRLATEWGRSAPLDRWRRTRQDIRRAIVERGYHPDRRAFTQAFGSDALDASALVIPIVGFLPATDPRFRSTVERVRSELMRDGLVYRYRDADGLPGGEAAFVLCSFWLVDALALGGQLSAARDLFERLVGYANDLGLLAEEIDPADRGFRGNFPQGFSHLGLINSAITLAKAAKHGPERRAETEAKRVGRAKRAAARS